MNWIARAAIKHRWLTIVLATLVAGASIFATINLKMELFPDFELPITTVVTVYPQAQPDDVVADVTIPIENAISGIEGLRHITSTSMENTSFIFAEFEFGTDMDEVNKTISQRLSELNLPQSVRDLPQLMPELGENPKLYPLNLNMMPVVILNLGGDLPVSELARIAQEQVIPALKNIEGIFEVSIEGGTSDNILINPDPESMSLYGISFAQLAGILSMGEYSSLSDIENAYLSPQGLQLKDVASVNLGPAPGTAISRTNGQPSIAINIMKNADANTVITANSILEKAAQIEESLPANLELVTILDQSQYIEDSISDLSSNAIIGSLLAVVVVFLFLMAFRASLITAISIPLSIIIGFLVMYLMGITINILTLSAMVIAVGRVIDNSIVILEVIFRRLRHGDGFMDAAVNGTKEVIAPITSATIATVVIFLPLIFVGGIVGELFVPFAQTITFALIASLLVAITIVPALSGWLVRQKKTAEKSSASWYQNIYSRTLKWSLNHRLITLGIATTLFLSSFGLMPLIGTTFMPETNDNSLQITLEMPSGTDILTVQDEAKKIEGVLASNPDVIDYNTIIGSSSSMFGSFNVMMGIGSSAASFTVTTGPETDALDIIEQLESTFATAGIQGKIDIITSSSSGDQMMSGLEIAVRGANITDISTTSEQLFSRLNQLAYLSDVESLFAGSQVRLSVEPDIAKLTAMGFTTEQIGLIGQELFLLKQGGTIAQVNLDGNDYGIFIKGILPQIEDPELAMTLKVGAPIAFNLGDIATVGFSQQATDVHRIDMKTAITITAAITQSDVGAANSEIQSIIDNLDLPEGVEISMGGVTEEMQESFSDMYIAIGIAIVLAYLVLVFTFRSLLNPLIIMASLPLASIGALLALLIAGKPLSVTGLMGILMLVGIVLTNAVVLIDVIEQRRKSGMPAFEALFSGSQTRLRPILMTAITTMIAMVPLALGAGKGVIVASELAVVVIGGLFSSTMLTLLVIPVLYAFSKRIKSPS